ncbi:MAG: hypothetical protein LBU28_08325 [Spirochaetaceae bacterium]|jgi:hypothetical protein|nr:hypothetical protein [Spirochaetaceae bacterium]
MNKTGLRRGIFLLALIALFTPGLFGREYNLGRIRLVLHEQTGRFSFFYLIDPNRNLYEPFFLNADPRTSFLAVMVNDRVYRLGDDPAFTVRIGGSPGNPALVFESPFLVVTQEFSFFQVSASHETNGVRMTIRAENKAGQEASVGIRVLLDTTLGEGNRSSAHFVTDLQTISAEIALDHSRNDQWWSSRNNRYGLMGSISFRGISRPDLIHFSNWKRLNDAAWKSDYVPGRSFDVPPSFGDSAVCYYYDPLPVGRNSSRTVSMLLSLADPRGFESLVVPADETLSRILRDSRRSLAPSSQTRDEDLKNLDELIRRMDLYAAGELFLSEEDLNIMAMVIAQLRSRYGLP